LLVDHFISVFNEHREKVAIVWNDNYYSYKQLIDDYLKWEKFLNDSKIFSAVIGLQGDFTPNCIAFLFAAINQNNIIAPFNLSAGDSIKSKLEIAGIEHLFIFNESDDFSHKPLNFRAEHHFYTQLRAENAPGLILFTSGTSGKPKAAVHDFNKLLQKFLVSRISLKTVNFLLFDHWGGLNTMFHTLSNGGVVLSLKNRTPDAVCSFIEKYNVELLPASPTFLNLLLISEAYKRFDLSSLKIISYGTEPMPENTLKRLNEIFPDVRLQQTYGLIELGVLRSKSKGNNSLWVKIGGEGFDVRVVDGMLQIKADSAMLGYLNAPSPFTDDGYFVTGDAVEVDGDYYKILGRNSELINVGGEKVFPREIENVIQEIDNVEDVTVFSEPNPITGQIVCAKIKLKKIQIINLLLRKLKAIAGTDLHHSKFL
jgi:long-chain acyl-CoA synthetase